MSDHDTLLPSRQLDSARTSLPSSFFLDAGDQVWRRVVEFFSAHLRNPNTRSAYAQAVGQFARWCQSHRITLQQVSPFLVAAYIEELQKRLAIPSQKQHLAAIRMLFDYLVTGQVVPVNPATAVRGPRHVVRKGLTPVLAAEEARTLLESIDASTLPGLRDRALIGVMVYSFARVGAVVAMNTEDYFPQGKRFWLRLHEKGGKLHDVPAHHKIEAYLDAYLAGTDCKAQKGMPLFRTLDRSDRLTERRMHRLDVLAMIKRPRDRPAYPRRCAATRSAPPVSHATC